jgi:apolipoprotein N-acyltransferase
MNEKLKTFIKPEKKQQVFWYLTISGILSGLCMAFPTVLGAVVEWISFIPAALALLFVSEKGVSLKRAFFGGFWLIYSQNVIVYHWFVSFYPLEFTGMSKLGAAGVVMIAVFGLPILAAIFGGLLGIVTVGVSRLPSATKYRGALPFVYASAYVLCEWVRTQFWFGVPWGRLSLGQLTEGTPFTILSSSVFGTYFVTFLIVLVSCLSAQALSLGKFKLRVILAVALILSNLLCGIVISSLSVETKTTVKVAAVQANISSREKWNASSKEIFTKYATLTIDAARDGADLIVWPETAITDNRYISNISELADELDAYILFGCFDYGEDGSPRNVLCMVSPEGEMCGNSYVKRHLVPFGEYVPMRKLIMTVFPPLGEIAMLSEDLVPGEESEIFEIEINGELIRVGGLICFDSIYEELAYATASDGADIICVATNDSWFEDSRAVYMHCAQSRLRAIETGLPIVRAANTGISADITRLGEMNDSIEPLVDGYLVCDVSISNGTHNAKVSNTLFLILCFVCICSLPCVNVSEYLFRKVK